MTADGNPDDPLVCVRRVRQFVTAREAFFAHRSMPKGGVRLLPECILAEYGRLDMADLLRLCDVATERDS